MSNNLLPSYGELIEAIHSWDAPLVKELLRRGADPYEKDIAGHSAMEIALWFNQQNMIDLLKDALKEQNHRPDPKPDEESLTEKHLNTLRRKHPGKHTIFKKK